MSIFSAGKAYYFSPVKGTLVKDGDPVKNIKIIRKWEDDDLEQDETISDEYGNFSFPEIRKRTVVQFIPAEFVVGQEISVIYEDKEVVIWSNSKRETSKNSELGGRELDLVCDLDSEEILYREFGSALFTKCTWK